MGTRTMSNCLMNKVAHSVLGRLGGLGRCLYHWPFDVYRACHSQLNSPILLKRKFIDISRRVASVLSPFSKLLCMSRGKFKIARQERLETSRTEAV